MYFNGSNGIDMWFCEPLRSVACQQHANPIISHIRYDVYKNNIRILVLGSESELELPNCNHIISSKNWLRAFATCVITLFWKFKLINLKYN